MCVWFIPKFYKLCGNFNIYSLVQILKQLWSFKGLQETFGLTQSFDGPTHELWAHFVISFGLSITLLHQTIFHNSLAAVFKDSWLNVESGLVSLLWTDSLLIVSNLLCNVGLCYYSLSQFAVWLTSSSGMNTGRSRLTERLHVSFGLFRDRLSAY